MLFRLLKLLGSSDLITASRAAGRCELLLLAQIFYGDRIFKEIKPNKTCLAFAQYGAQIRKEKSSVVPHSAVAWVSGRASQSLLNSSNAEHFLF